MCSSDSSRRFLLFLDTITRTNYNGTLSAIRKLKTPQLFIYANWRRSLQGRFSVADIMGLNSSESTSSKPEGTFILSTVIAT